MNKSGGQKSPKKWILQLNGEFLPDVIFPNDFSLVFAGVDLIERYEVSNNRSKVFDSKGKKNM